MELLSLLAFLSVAMGGGFILYNRQNKRPTPRWIVTGHGLGAAGALLLLITAVLTSKF